MRQAGLSEGTAPKGVIELNKPRGVVTFPRAWYHRIPQVEFPFLFFFFSLLCLLPSLPLSCPFFPFVFSGSPGGSSAGGIGQGCSQADLDLSCSINGEAQVLRGKEACLPGSVPGSAPVSVKAHSVN